MTRKPKKRRKKPRTRGGTIDRLFASVEDDLFSLAEEESGAESRWNRPRKQRISLRMDREVVDWFKSKGPGYQTRKLVVEEKRFLQYFLSFETEIYLSQRDDAWVKKAFMPEGFKESAGRNRKERIGQAARELSHAYQLDFVTDAGLPDYLTLIEKQVAAVQTRDWPTPETPKA